MHLILRKVIHHHRRRAFRQEFLEVIELKRSLKNPAASSCAEDGLIRVLRKYDQRNSDHRLVEEIALGQSFKTPDGRVFIRGERLRKRFKCREAASGREYLFSPVYEVLSCAF